MDRRNPKRKCTEMGASSSRSCDDPRLGLKQLFADINKTISNKTGIAYTSAVLEGLKFDMTAFIKTVGGDDCQELLDSKNAEAWWDRFDALLDAYQLLEAHADISKPPVEVDDGQMELEFEQEYKDPEGRIVNYVLGYVNRCYQSWSLNRPSWYAPCTAIVQSSGWGKSRSIREIALANNGVCVLYFSLMHPEGRGYPKSNRDIYNLFKDLRTVEEGYAFIEACFVWISKLKSLTLETMQELFVQHQKSRNYEGILSCWRRKKKGTVKAMCDAVKKAKKKHQEFLTTDGIAFLFVLDEARSLLPSDNHEMGLKSPFYNFRRACSDLPSNGGVFFVFIDTHSKVSNFTPSNMYDPSTRVIRLQKSLFPPICRIPSFDLPWVSPTGRTLEQVADPDTLFRQGRPLWAARNFSGWEIVEFALQKLLTGVNPGSIRGKELLGSPIGSLALLGRRIAVDVCPQSHVADKLVASHMGVCLYVSFSRESVYSATLPEPVLSEAAAHHYKEHPDDLRSHLEDLNTLLLNGISSAGERGELVARFLLIDAMDNLPENKDFTKPVFLRVFLKKVFPKFSGFSGTCSNLRNAKVFFNSFHRFFGEPAIKDLQVFIKKCSAMVCKKNQQAYDLIIPIVLPGADRSYDVEDNNCIGYVAVQVRNRQIIKDVAGSIKEMKDYQAWQIQCKQVAPSFLILLHLATTTTQRKYEPQNDDVLLVTGLNEEEVNSDFHPVLALLLEETPDALQILTSEYRKYKSDRSYEHMASVEIEEDALKTIMASVLP